MQLALLTLGRPGRRTWPWLLVLAVLLQGFGQGFARIASPSHGHRAMVTASQSDDDHVAPRDGHRSLPRIGAQPTHAHAALGAAAHAHAFDDASVVYLDADGDLADAAPAVAALGPPPGSPTSRARPEGHAAWARAPGWHALARTTAPPERPPRGVTAIA